jgi:Uma2 family endonuclease
MAEVLEQAHELAQPAFRGDADDLAQPPLIIHPLVAMNDDQFFEFCQRNPEVRIERTSQGDLIFMTPAAGESSSGNFELAALFAPWVRQNGEGRAFDSSGGFILPNTAVRSPDIAWVRKERLKQLRPGTWKKFIPLAPDFVMELKSRSDRLSDLRRKMEDYIDNGVRLGWLFDPVRKEVHVYRPDKKPEVLSNPRSISGDPVLPGFTLDLWELWLATQPES